MTSDGSTSKGHDKARAGRRRQLTGRLGQSQVATLLIAMGLTPRTEDCDNGEDFNIEIQRTDGRWERLFVQVKGSDNGFKSTREGQWAVRLKANAVERYRQASHPIVLIAVEVKTGEFRWDDLRAIARAQPGPLTVHLPPARRLSPGERESFIAQLLRLAEEWRARLQPAPMTLAQEEARLRALDSRLGVRLTASSSGTIHEFWSIGDAPLVTMQGELDPAAVERFEEHVRFGTPLIAEFKNFAMTGSPVFEERGIEATALIEIVQPGTEQDIALGWMDEEGAFHAGVEGRAIGTAGTDGIEVRLRDPSLPLSLTLRRTLANPIQTPPAPMIASMKVDVTCWYGKPYRVLPWWDGLYGLLTALAAGAPCAMAKREFGQYVHQAHFRRSVGLPEFARNALNQLGPLPSIVAAARLCGSEAHFLPGEISLNDLRTWTIIAKLLNQQLVSIRPRSFYVDALPDDIHDGKVSRVHFLWQMDLPLLGESIGQLPMLTRLTDCEIIGEVAPGSPILRPTSSSTCHLLRIDQPVEMEAMVNRMEQMLDPGSRHEGQ